jgi:hypothetical protein
MQKSHISLILLKAFICILFPSQLAEYDKCSLLLSPNTQLEKVLRSTLKVDHSKMLSTSMMPVEESSSIRVVIVRLPPLQFI